MLRCDIDEAVESPLLLLLLLLLGGIISRSAKGFWKSCSSGIREETNGNAAVKSVSKYILGKQFEGKCQRLFDSQNVLLRYARNKVYKIPIVDCQDHQDYQALRHDHQDRIQCQGILRLLCC